MTRFRSPALLALAAVLAVAACGGSEGMEESPADMNETLGPVDGHDLPPTDLDRVQAGEVAPDFTLESYEGPRVSLSDFRGEKNVVLVFYRGHW